jgi:selenocysteine-specific elongation factor
VQVSGATGEGLPALREALDGLVTRLPPAPADADVRLWVDRAFTVRGAGTVVTGTLTAGRLCVGDELVLRGERVRVRGLQSLGQATDEARPVARVAVNLRGVAVDDVGRGDALLTPSAWLLTSQVDVRVSAPTHAEVVLHLGTAAVPAHVRPLDDRTARLRLSRPLPLRAGDRGVLRDPGAQQVAAGVHVLDADPPSLRRRGAARARAEVLATPLDLRAEVTRRGFVRTSHLVALGLEVTDLTGLVRHGDWLADHAQWAACREHLAAAVRAVPPEQGGLTHEAARQAAGLPDLALLAPLTRDAGLSLGEGRVRAPARGLGAAEAGVAALERHLAQRPFDAPERDVLRRLRLDPTALAAAERAGRLLRLGPVVVVLPGAPDLAARRLAQVAQPFAVGDATRALGTSRRVTIPLLELLDRRGLTRRLADGTRELVSPARPA